MGSAITGWGTAVPETVLHNDELAARLGIEPSWIEQRTGITSRHVASSSQTTSDLATEAALRALEIAEVEPATLDIVILATITPDLQLPATACLVQAALGATGAAAFDLNAGCSGFLYALAQAQALIAAGTVRRAVVIGADVLSRIIDYSDPKSCVLFGDGAGAVVIEKTEGPDRIGPFQLGGDGSEPHLLWVSPETGKVAMEGREVYRRAVDQMSRSIEKLCRDQGLAVDDVDLFVAHQANARILEAVAARSELDPEKVLSNIARYGNTSAASIPLALVEAVSGGRLTDGDVVVLTAFGAGFTWGAGLVRWGVWSHELRRKALSAGARA